MTKAHPLHHTLHALRDLLSLDRSLKPRRDRVYSRRQSQIIQLLIFLTNRVLSVYTSAFRVALLDGLRRVG